MLLIPLPTNGFPAQAAPAYLLDELAALGGSLVDTTAFGETPCTATQRALDLAIAARQAVLLLPDGITLLPGALAELAAALETQPMAGFVAPRLLPATAALATMRRLAPSLPRFIAATLPPPGALLLRATMAAEFGPLDPAYGDPTTALADLVLRANRCGHRVLVANRALAQQAAPSGAAASAPAMASLVERHPSLPRSLDRDAAASEVEALLVPLAAERPSVVFTCDYLPCVRNGTAELVAPTIAAFAQRHGAAWQVLVAGDAEVLHFHGLDRLPGVEPLTLSEATRRAPFGAAIRLCQPHNLADLLALGRMAALPGVVMLDTIALDCQHLDEADLGPTYAALPEAVALLGAISGFSLAQLERHVELPPELTRFVMPLSADPTEYPVAADVRPPGLPAPGYLLLIGNHYPHKHLAPTLAALRAAGYGRRLALLGAGSVEGADWCAPSGDLPPASVAALYGGAHAVLYPSHYEGFGLPLLHALAHRRPVLARDLPAAREVKAWAAGWGANIHLATDTAGLVRLACDPPAWTEPALGGQQPQGWAAAADALAAALDEARAGLTVGALARRLRCLAWLEAYLAERRVRALESMLSAEQKARWRLVHRLEMPEGPRLLRLVLPGLRLLRRLMHGRLPELPAKFASTPERLMMTAADHGAIRARSGPP